MNKLYKSTVYNYSYNDIYFHGEYKTNRHNIM